jgi:hypothetical protein
MLDFDLFTMTMEQGRIAMTDREIDSVFQQLKLGTEADRRRYSEVPRLVEGFEAHENVSASERSIVLDSTTSDDSKPLRIEDVRA